MAKGQLSIRLSPALLKEIDKLIDAGEFSTYSDFVEIIVTRWFERNQCMQDMENNIEKFINSEKGVKILESQIDNIAMKKLFAK